MPTYEYYIPTRRPLSMETGASEDLTPKYRGNFGQLKLSEKDPKKLVYQYSMFQLLESHFIKIPTHAALKTVGEFRNTVKIEHSRWQDHLIPALKLIVLYKPEPLDPKSSEYIACFVEEMAPGYVLRENISHLLWFLEKNYGECEDIALHISPIGWVDIVHNVTWQLKDTRVLPRFTNLNDSHVFTVDQLSARGLALMQAYPDWEWAEA